MGSHVSKQLERRKAISSEKKALSLLQGSSCCLYPGYHYRPSDLKNWMSCIGPEKLLLNNIVWPGTHHSATDKIGIPFLSRPFAQRQSLSIYHQLVSGTRFLSICVQRDRHVCHGILTAYSVDVVLDDLKRFLSETQSEVVILEIRTESGHEDPPEFEKYLVEQLGEYLIHQDDHVFNKTVAELLPKRVICVWKPLKQTQSKHGDPLWSAAYLRDNLIDTDLPSTKFESNVKHLSEQPTVSSRKFFYRVENTIMPKADNPIVCGKSGTNRIHDYTRLFITECIKRGCADRLQIFSTDFIDIDFVNVSVGLTYARAEGRF